MKIRKMIGLGLTLTLPVAPLWATPESGGGQNASHGWSYGGESGPFGWGNLIDDFKLCKEGRKQSPVDISAATVTSREKLEIQYADTPITITNNGHTVKVDYADGSHVIFNDKKFSLKQFHFHARSEHTLGGRDFPLEAHFVHQSDDGQLAVVGVLFEKGTEHPVLGEVFAHLPKIDGETRILRKKMINAAALLPQQRNFYAYTGSLTTPPCTEGVQWLVMAEPVSIGENQLQAFMEIFDHNYRPVQPINGRVVRLNF